MARRRVIYYFQVLSLAWIWIFVLSVAVWIFTLLRTATRLNDSINASVAIGIIAIPVFMTIAATLTYVFVGLQRHRIKSDPFEAAHGDRERSGR